MIITKYGHICLSFFNTIMIFFVLFRTFGLNQRYKGYKAVTAALANIPPARALTAQEIFSNHNVNMMILVIVCLNLFFLFCVCIFLCNCMRRRWTGSPPKKRLVLRCVDKPPSLLKRTHSAESMIYQSSQRPIFHARHEPLIHARHDSHIYPHIQSVQHASPAS